MAMSIADHITEVLKILQHDLTDAGMVDTPNRIARFLGEFHQNGNLGEILKARFPCKSKGMVVQANIPFRGLCEHHFLPFFGEAHVGYIPNKTVVGLSKLTRFVQAAGVRRPGIQERITDEIADTLHRVLDANGVIVVVSAEHTCMSVRGINTPGVSTTTSALRGLFRDVPAARDEFFTLVRGASKRRY